MFKKKILISSLITLGFVSLSFQIISLREMLVIFSGNELSLGIILGNWLILVGLGAWLGGHIVDKLKQKEKSFILLQILTAFLLPLEIGAIRILRPWLQKTPSEMLGFSLIIIYSFLVLSLSCIFFGVWFVLGSSIFSDRENSESPALPIAKAYGFESLGAIGGGLITSFFLVRYFSVLETAFFLSALTVFTAFLFAFNSANRFPRLTWFCSFILVLNISIIFSGQINKWEKAIIAWQWRPFQLIENKNSVYGNISVIKLNEQYSFYENGNILFSTFNEQYNEELVNFVLLSHPQPKKILLLGGGISGNLQQILKYPIEKLVYVELDPLLIKLAGKYVDRKNRLALNDSRLTMFYGDGRFYIKNSREKFDCIIADIPDPNNGLINRFYTEEFFQEVKNILNPQGIFELSLTSSENYMSNELKLLSGTIYGTLKKVFNSCTVVPGTRNYFLASVEENFLVNPAQLIQRIKQRKISLTYLTPYYLNYLLKPDRIKRIMNWITEIKSAQREINKDLSPICYFYGVLFQSSYFGQTLPKILAKSKNINLLLMISIVLGIAGCFLITPLKGAGKKNLSLSLVMILTAFTSMLLQLVTMFAFQMIYGYLYYQLGMLITFCMAGIASGNWLAVKTGKHAKPELVILSTVIALFIYALALPLIFKIHFPILFAFLTFFAGLPVGLIFPLVNQLYLENQPSLGKSVGRLYSSDVWGATLGAFLGSIIFIPILGIAGTSILSGIVMTAGIVISIKLKQSRCLLKK
ncbi:MAG: fused MFS/spermidine synthase [Elusimicrobiota bacterium]